MEIQEITLPSQKKSISIEVVRKRMKTIRLKVYPNCSIKISVPLNTPVEIIEKFLKEKEFWIDTKINGFKKTSGYASTNAIRNGMSIKMFGEDLIFSVSKCGKNCVYRDNKIINICSTDVNNQEKLLNFFEKWWRREAIQILSNSVEKLYPIIKKYNIPMPKIMLRKMATLWGSCSVHRGIITFNQYLIKASSACIDYVVLHELVHFIYPNHGKQFYDFLSIYMPDWKERKKILDQDVVHGL